MTTRSASRRDAVGAAWGRGAWGPPLAAERIASAGRGLVLWYQAVRRARASASCRYRMGHFAELLGGATTIVDRAPPPGSLRGARTLVVVRPELDHRARATLAWARSRGVRLVADYDDLLFDGDPADHPLVLNRSITVAAAADRIARHRGALPLFDAFTVATQPLAEALRGRVGAPVTRVPNGLSARWVDQGRALARPWRPGDPRVIRYLSGSPSHDHDLAAILPVIATFLQHHPEVRFETVGPVRLAAGALPPGRVTQLRRVPFVDLPRLYASSWVTLAPLRPTGFNACRSAIKLLEAAAFEAPCVATPIDDMVRHRDSGVLLARDEGDWYRALTSLLADERRVELGRQARAWVDRHARAEEGASLLAALSGPG